MRPLLVALAGLLAACFDPSYSNLQCGTDGTCPSGYSCATGNHCMPFVGSGSGSGSGSNDIDAGSNAIDAGPVADAPPGGCAANGLPPTTIAGRVFAPNNELPLPNVTVYVPRTTPGAFPTTQTCGRCTGALPGDSIAHTTTAADGSFSLPVTEGDDVPLVITTGRWRRQLKVPHVTACATTTLSVLDSSLPKSQTDLTAHTTSVDLPRIAVSTGALESMECLLHQLGVDDSEFGTAGDTGRHVHLYDGQGASSFAPGFGGASANFAPSVSLWGSASAPASALASYDLVYLACEGAANITPKDTTAMANMKHYADLGGRVMLTHYQYVWMAGMSGAQQTIWPTLAKFDDTGVAPGDPVYDHVEEALAPHATNLASWLVAVGASSVRDQVLLATGNARATCLAVDHDHVDELVSLPPAGPTAQPQLIEFSTPAEKPAAQRCGKVEFSDVHLVTSLNGPVTPFPNGCDMTTDLAAQDLLIAWEIFDIGTCVDH